MAVHSVSGCSVLVCIGGVQSPFLFHMFKYEKELIFVVNAIPTIMLIKIFQIVRRDENP